MKKLLTLALLLPLLTHAASYRISDITRTNSTLSSTSLVEVSAAATGYSNGFTSRAITLGDLVKAGATGATEVASSTATSLDFWRGLTNTPATRTLDFANYTNGRPGGWTFGDWYVLYSSTGIFTNQSYVTNGALRLDTRTTSNGSHYICLSAPIPVRKVAAVYRPVPVNPGAPVNPQLVVSVSRSSFGTVGGTLSLAGPGAHCTFTQAGVEVRDINGGIGALIGTLAWTFPGPINPADGLVWTVYVEFDQENSRILFSGDGISGAITNAQFSSLLPVGTNTSHVFVQSYNADTTNIAHVMDILAVGVENRPASDMRTLSSLAGTAAQLNRANYFRRDNTHLGTVHVTNTVGTWGASSGYQAGRRDATAGDVNEIWINYHPASGYLSWQRNTFAAPTWEMGMDGATAVFRPGDYMEANSQVAWLGTATNRFDDIWFKPSTTNAAPAVMLGLLTTGQIVATERTAWLTNGFTQVVSAGTAETNLIVYTVPGATLSADGGTLVFRATGTTANNAGLKQLRVKFGATTIFDAGSIAIQNATWVVDGEITRTGAATQIANVRFTSSTATLIASALITTPGETLSGAVDLKLTGQSAANGDITQRTMTVYKLTR